MKKCTRCGEAKPPDGFHRRKASRDGREAVCKTCRSAYYTANKERMDANSKRWKQENLERHKATRNARNAERREEINAQSRAWKDANRERVNQQARERYDVDAEALRRADYKARNPDWHKNFYWANHEAELARGKRKRLANPEAERAKGRRWRQANPEAVRENTRRRRARNRDRLTENIDLDALVLAGEGRCGICSTDLFEPIELDHIVPISREGHHTQDNCQLTHRSCNRQKHDKLPDECGSIGPFL